MKAPKTHALGRCERAAEESLLSSHEGKGDGSLAFDGHGKLAFFSPPWCKVVNTVERNAT